MRLTVDARVWKTGIGTYTLNLLSDIRQAEPRISVTAIVRAEAESTVSPLCDKTIVVDVPIYTAKEQLRIPMAARGCDLLHVPHYNVPVLYAGPLVVTIHDLTHLTQPEFSITAKSWLYARPMLHFAARRASHIVTVSEHSKKEIVKRLGVAGDKVRVIYNGVGPQFRPVDRNAARTTVQSVTRVDRPYVLFVGNLKPHKNLGTLVRAFARVRSRNGFGHLLVLIGDDRGHRQELLDEAARLGLSHVIRHIPWLSDELLPQAYAAADVVVMPSTCEGFGLPVLEAMACGTPVVSSNAAALPEIGANAVVYFNPRNGEEMAAAIQRVIDSPSLQAELREKGLKRAAMFTWEQSAREHLEVYRKVLERE